MKAILIMALCLISFTSIAQTGGSAYGGEIRARDRNGNIGTVARDSVNLRVTDSVLTAVIRQLKTQDSALFNIQVALYELFRNNLSNPVDNKLGTRDTILQEVLQDSRLATKDTILQQVLASGRLKVQDDTSQHHTVKVIELPPLSIQDSATLASWSYDTSIKARYNMGWDYVNNTPQIPFIASDGGTIISALDDFGTPYWLNARSTDGAIKMYSPDQKPIYNAGNANDSTQRVILANEQGQDLIVVGQSGQTALSRNIILEVAGNDGFNTFKNGVNYNSGMFHLTTSGTVNMGATLAIEGCNDSINWVALPYTVSTWGTLGTFAINISTNYNQIIFVNSLPKFVRIRITNALVGGGSIKCVSVFSRQPLAQQTISGTVNIQGGAGNTAILKNEDNGCSTGFQGIGIITVRQDTLLTTTDANYDANWVSSDRTGTLIVKDQRIHRRTYSSSFTVTPASAATDIVEIIGGSKKVLVNKIVISGTATADSYPTVSIIKRSSVATGGTSNTETSVPHDATDVAATAVIKSYSANPTVGTTVGSIRKLNIPLINTAPSAVSMVYPYEITLSDLGKAVWLNSNTQTLCLNLGGTTITGASINVSIEFTETGE